MTPAIWKGKTKRFWPYMMGLILATGLAFFLFAGLNPENVSYGEPWATLHEVIVKNVGPFSILMASVAGLFCFCAVSMISLSSPKIK